MSVIKENKSFIHFAVFGLISMFVLFFSCGQNRVRPTEVAETWDDGTPKKEFEWFNTGVAGSLRELYYYENGKLKLEKIFIEGHLEKETFYAKTGEIEAIFVYEKGRRVFGAEYYKNGQPMGNIPKKLNGSTQGFVEYYHEDGSVKSNGRYENDKKQGVWRDYNESGDVIKEIVFDAGEQIKMTSDE